MANTNHRGTPGVDLLSAAAVLAGAQASETNSDALDRALIGEPYEVGQADAAGRRYFQLGGACRFPVYEAAGVVWAANEDDHLEEPALRAFRTWLRAYDAEGEALAYAAVPSAPKPAALAALGLGLCPYCPEDVADLACECTCPGAVAARSPKPQVIGHDARGERAA